MLFRLLIGVASVALIVACDRMDSPATPTAAGAFASTGTAAAAQRSLERKVIINDACEPDSFNAVVGPGTCVGHGGVTFEQLIEQLTRTGTVGSWFFAPPNANVRVGEEFVV